jgi:hypothetical protein
VILSCRGFGHGNAKNLFILLLQSLRISQLRDQNTIECTLQ